MSRPGGPSSPVSADGTDCPLTTADCAAIVGFGDEEFYAREIDALRLAALIIQRPGRHTIRRVSPVALERWRRTYTNYELLTSRR